jgi:hypothetical protein
VSGDVPNPLARTTDPQALLLERASDRSRLVWAYAQALINEACYDLSVAQQLRIPATRGLTEAQLCSSMEKAAVEQRKERRAALKAAGEVIAQAVATARFAREIEKDVGETIDAKAEDATPLDPATQAIKDREERDKKERARRFDESRRRAQANLATERKAEDLPPAPDPLPATP